MTRQKPLKLSAKDSVKVTDNIITDKWWFNGVKRFFTIKVLPKQK